MGLSGGSKTQSNKPIYSAQIEGAANNANATYAAQAPKLTGVTDALGTLVPGLIDKFKNGDPGVNAATAYNTDVLNGKYLDAGNPYLEQMVSQTNDNARNGLASSLGTRGLTGGSAFADIITRALAQNETGLRYTDYSNERNRMGEAASRAPTLSYASYQPLGALGDIANAQMLPMQAAGNLSQQIGGLLGQYQTQKVSQNPGLLGGLGGLVSLGTDIASLGSGLGLWKFKG